MNILKKLEKILKKLEKILKIFVRWGGAAAPLNSSLATLLNWAVFLKPAHHDQWSGEWEGGYIKWK